jgi:hypothetical protein
MRNINRVIGPVVEPDRVADVIGPVVEPDRVADEIRRESIPTLPVPPVLPNN